MKVFAISDLHLSGNNPKPMDIFGRAWENYMAQIERDWRARVSDDDLVLVAGDISWAMTLPDAVPDLRLFGAFPGKKVILRGNHDYWWKAIGAVRAALPHGMFAVQNDCLRFGDVLVCGSRGWTTPESGGMGADDQKIYDREAVRLSLSLQDMEKQRKEGDRVVAMIHFPPFNSKLVPSPFTTLFEQHKVDAVVHGHLHGAPGKQPLTKTVRGIRYYLTSCDLCNNKLQEIL